MTREPDDPIRAPGIRGPLLGNEGPREPYKPPYADGLPGHGDTEASRDAAEAWLEKAGLLQKRVYAVIKKAREQGATLTEIHGIVGGSEYSMSPRIQELLEQKLIYDSGETRVITQRCPHCDEVLRTTRAQTIWKARWR